jgi:hypothetical protein
LPLIRIADAIGFETFERLQPGWQLTLGPRIDRENRLRLSGAVLCESTIGKEQRGDRSC